MPSAVIIEGIDPTPKNVAAYYSPTKGSLIIALTVDSKQVGARANY
jgi:hypothetical protein